MRLQRQQFLPQARIKKVKIELGAEEHKVTLEIQTALTKDLADNFGCRELIFAGDIPRSGVEKFILEGSEIDCDVHLKHDGFAFSTVVEEMGHYVAKMEGTGPELWFQVRFKGYVITVADLIEHVKCDPIEITLKPAQLDLNLKDEGVEDGPCVDCNNGVPLVEDNLAMHASGQACAAAPVQEELGPALASANEMGTGTHQKADKRPRRKPAEDVGSAADDFLAEVGLSKEVQ